MKACIGCGLAVGSHLVVYFLSHGTIGMDIFKSYRALLRRKGLLGSTLFLHLYPLSMSVIVS